MGVLGVLLPRPKLAASRRRCATALIAIISTVIAVIANISTLVAFSSTLIAIISTSSAGT